MPTCVRSVNLGNSLCAVEPDDANPHFGRGLLQRSQTDTTMAPRCRRSGTVHLIDRCLRDECLNETPSSSLRDARDEIAGRRRHWNDKRPNSNFGSPHFSGRVSFP
jgi:hypothetical protein